jgi:hypothetical protein
MPAFPLPQRLLALSAALLAAAALALAGVPGAAAAQPGPDVVVLGGGDEAATTAVLAALQARGLSAARGPESASFSGDSKDLKGAEVVVLLNNTGPNARLSARGADALSRFVEKGGGLVAGQWSLLDPQIAPLMPAVHCGLNSARATTFSRVAPHPFIIEGVPQSFTIALSSVSGSEGCLQPRDEALVLYASSNGGGRENAAGLASWNAGKGRAAAFSTTLGATELQSAELRTLFQNTVAWLASTRDSTPPRVRSFVVSGAGGVVSSRQVQITLTASDSGGSGVGSYLIREYGFSGNLSDGWASLGAVSWQPYQQPGASFTWTLGDRPGVHYLQAFVADRAGNITPAATVAVVNYRPEQVSIGQDELHIYRIAPGAGVATEVRMDVRAGNPDLYVFGPAVTFTPESDDPVERTNFTARDGVYQIEVEGHVAGSYSLAVTTAAAPTAAVPFAPGPGGHGLDRRPRISFSAVEPPAPPEDPSGLPAPSADPAAAPPLEEVFLPMVRQ